MTIRKITLTGLTAITCLLFASCGNSNIANVAKKPFTSVAKIKMPRLMPKRIPIAEVRKKDLKTMQTGAEKALAFEQRRNRRRFAFIPGFYKAPTLPDVRSLPADGGILPPLKQPKNSTE